MTDLALDVGVTASPRDGDRPESAKQDRRHLVRRCRGCSQFVGCAFDAGIARCRGGATQRARGYPDDVSGVVGQATNLLTGTGKCVGLDTKLHEAPSLAGGANPTGNRRPPSEPPWIKRYTRRSTAKRHRDEGE